ncbi:MAG: META domain-containing protein [Paracoccaceae bacterium]
MRLLTLLAAVSMTACATAQAQTVTDTEWQLLAVDGTFYEANATLQIADDGSLTGSGPCNRWSARNATTLPDLKIEGLRATRMACDRLADEQVFFDVLIGMTGVKLAGPKNLVLQGPGDRSMKFSLISVMGLPDCTTCAAKD